MESIHNQEKALGKFYISIRKNNEILGNFDKVEIDLDTSKNIVIQAEKFSCSLLDSLDIPDNSRNDISWKIFRNQGNSYGMVTKSKNWKHD